MNRQVIADRLYDRSRKAQEYRRGRLTPPAIRQHLTDWAERAGLGAELAAVGLIEMTAMLECSPAERVTLIDRILDVLAEVTEEIDERAARRGAVMARIRERTEHAEGLPT